MTKKDMTPKNDITNRGPQSIERVIYTFRGVQVMLDRDLAKMYNVETKALNQAVKRNSGRFPERFMFQLSKEEFDKRLSQKGCLFSFCNTKISENSDMAKEADPKGLVSFLYRVS